MKRNPLDVGMYILQKTIAKSDEIEGFILRTRESFTSRNGRIQRAGDSNLYDLRIKREKISYRQEREISTRDNAV